MCAHNTLINNFLSHSQLTTELITNHFFLIGACVQIYIMYCVYSAKYYEKTPHISMHISVRGSRASEKVVQKNCMHYSA